MKHDKWFVLWFVFMGIFSLPMVYMLMQVVLGTLGWLGIISILPIIEHFHHIYFLSCRENCPR